MRSVNTTQPLIIFLPGTIAWYAKSQCQARTIAEYIEATPVASATTSTDHRPAANLDGSASRIDINKPGSCY